MNRLMLHLVLPLLMLATGWRVQQQFRAARQPLTPEGLREAVRLDPKAPGAHFRLGLAHRDVPELWDPELARGLLEKAIELNPHSWRYRRELAQLHELAGRIPEAEAAFLEAVQRNPQSTGYRWRLANFYLRHRPLDKSLPQLERALVDRRLWAPALGLLLGAGAGYPEIDRVWPKDSEARQNLFRLLCLRLASKVSQGQQNLRLVPGREVLQRLWPDLVAGAEPIPLADGQLYLDLLFFEQRFDEARRRWIELAANHGLRDASFEDGSHRIWNGQFALPLTKTGLGWQMPTVEGLSAEMAAGEGSEGSNALRLDFDGSQNLSQVGIEQRVLVDPGRSYRLTVRTRSQALTSDQGVYLAVLEGASRQRLATTGKVLGTQPWTSQVVDFDAPGSWLRIGLWRDESSRVDGQIRGILWIDSVRLETLP